MRINRLNDRCPRHWSIRAGWLFVALGGATTAAACRPARGTLSASHDVEDVTLPSPSSPVPDRESARTRARSPAERGKTRYEQNCAVCHSIDGTRLVGPTWKGLWGRVEKLDTDGGVDVSQSGVTVTVDEIYVKRSLFQPSAQVVFGYQPIMPTFEGALSDEDASDIVDFIRQLE